MFYHFIYNNYVKLYLIIITLIYMWVIEQKYTIFTLVIFKINKLYGIPFYFSYKMLYNIKKYKL